MTFTSSIFLIGVLPWFVIIFDWFVNRKGKVWTNKIFLFLANSVFLIWGGMGSFLMLCAYTIIIWLLSLLIIMFSNRWILAISLILATLPLVLIKYTVFILQIINTVIGCDISISNILVPIGISFITFEAISLLVDIYRGRIDKCPSLLCTYLYLTFFPTVTSGPILRYKDFGDGLQNPDFMMRHADSIQLIAKGLCKKVLIADKIAILADYYFNGVAAGNSYSSTGLWIGSIAYTLQLYFDFSGYSDMAIGIGRLLGFNIRKNFNRPYDAVSISDFWKRWHISLTQWFRDYVYIPLGGNRCSVTRHLFNMFIVWLLTGIWHGADWSFIIWGLGYYVLLVAEKYIPVMKKVSHGIIGHIYTMFFVNLLWVFFRAKNLSIAISYLRGMFFISGQIEEKAIRFMPFLIVTIFICFPWSKMASGFFDKKGAVFVKKIAFVVVVILALCAVVNSSYAPYIYGNF